MNKEEKITAAVKGMNEDLGIDANLALSLINKFIQSLPQQLKDIKNSRQNGAEFERLVHTLKGTSGNLRLNALYESAACLNESIKNIDIESIDLNLQNLENEINSFLE